MDRFQEPKQPKVHDYCEECGGVRMNIESSVAQSSEL